MAKEIHAEQPKIQFHAVSCVAHNKICKAQSIDGYPTVKLFKEGSYISEKHEIFSLLNTKTILTTLGFDSEAKQTSFDKINSIHVDPQSERKGGKKTIRGESQNKPELETNIARLVPFHSHEVVDAWHDAATSFEFSLKYNIYMTNGKMSKKEQNAFLDWLELLADTLPPQMSRTLAIIKHLLGELVIVNTTRKKACNFNTH